MIMDGAETVLRSLICGINRGRGVEEISGMMEEMKIVWEMATGWRTDCTTDNGRRGRSKYEAYPHCCTSTEYPGESLY